MKGAILCDTVLEAVTGVDAAVIVTEWDELRGLASPGVRDVMARPLIVFTSHATPFLSRRLRSPSRIVTTRFSSLLNAVSRFNRPFGLPFGLPVVPGGKRLWIGGLQ